MSAALSVRGLVKEYVPGKPVLRGIDLDFEARGISAVIGPSGTGKSTLIRCINRLVEPTAGQVIFEGQDLVALPRGALRMARRRIGMVFQEYNLVERLSVMENLLCGRLGYVSPLKAWLRRYPERDIARAFELLDIVGLGEFAQARADSLSGRSARSSSARSMSWSQPRFSFCFRLCSRSQLSPFSALRSGASSIARRGSAGTGASSSSGSSARCEGARRSRPEQSSPRPAIRA